MKIKTIAIFILGLSMLVSSSIIVNTALNSNDEVKQGEITSIFQNAISQADVDEEYIEHHRITHANGDSIETYVDRANYLEQIDTYENNELVSRQIFYDEGSKLLSIGKNNDKYEAVVMTLDSEIADENKRLFEEISEMERFISDDLEEYEKDSFKKIKDKDSSILKYSSDKINLYFDEETNFLLKKEYIKDGDIYQTIEFEKIDKTSKLYQSLFEQNAPIKGKNINLNNLETTYINQGKDVPLEEAKG